MRHLRSSGTSGTPLRCDPSTHSSPHVRGRTRAPPALSGLPPPHRADRPRRPPAQATVCRRDKFNGASRHPTFRDNKKKTGGPRSGRSPRRSGVHRKRSGIGSGERIASQVVTRDSSTEVSLGVDGPGATRPSSASARPPQEAARCTPAVNGRTGAVRAEQPRCVRHTGQAPTGAC